MSFFKQLLNNKIVRNSFVLINGTIISQVINIILSPIMSRLYSPADFGNYAAITAMVAIIAVIANGKYDLAIMDSEDTPKQRKATYYVGMGLTTISVFIILLIGYIITGPVKLLNYTMWDVLIIAIFTFFTSNNSILNIWLNKIGNYKQISRNRILYSAVHAIGVLVFGILKFGYMGIIFSTLLAYIIQFVYVYYFLYKYTDFKKLKCNKGDINEQIKKHLQFPKFQMPALLCNNASTQTPVILLKNLFSVDVSGWYSMTVKIINLPMSIIGTAIGEVFFKEASGIKATGDDERLKEFTYNTFKKISILGILPMCTLLCYGDILFSFVLGEQWRMAGTYAMLLAPWYYVGFVTSPFTHLFVVLDKQSKNLILNIVMLLTRVSSIIIGFWIFGNKNSVMTILIFALIGFLVYLATNGYLFKLVGISYRKSVLNTILIFLGGSIFFALPRILISSIV